MLNSASTCPWPAGIIPLALSLACGLAGCTVDAQGNSAPMPRDAVAAAATAFANLYETIDAASVDAYFVETLLDPSLPFGTAEPCVRTDNALGTRPSPLAHPPLAASSIEQRARLVAALGAYEIAIASLGGDAPEVESSLDVRDLQRDVFELNDAANEHAQGDLFIEDDAAKLTPLAAELGNATRERARDVVANAAPTVTKLIAIMSDDAAHQHIAALGASRLDYDRWRSYFDALQGSAASVTSGRRSTAPQMPRCLEPAFPPDAPTPLATLPPAGTAAFPGREAVLARLRGAAERYNAVREADPSALDASLSGLDEAAKNQLNSPGDETHAALQRALTQFAAAARAFAASTQPLQPH